MAASCLRKPPRKFNWDFYNENAYWINKGNLGCSLTHLKTYKAIIDRNLDFGLVLEDDTNLSPHLPEFLNSVESSLTENEVILLYYCAWKKSRFKKEKKTSLPGHLFTIPLDLGNLTGGNAYIITKAACKTVLEFQTPLQASTDECLTYYEKKAVGNCRCVYPLLADAADFKSSVDYINQSTILGKLLVLVNRYELFPFFQLIKLRRSRQRKKMLNFEIVD
jgi:GR25 family glycosyltransferase involved in LPS biosynthesis